MKFLLDTDHISILQKQSGSEYAVLIARIAQVTRAELAFSIVSFHEQVLGCNAYIA
jgi:tRNA(fMet)-specific endonuclease VapC